MCTSLAGWPQRPGLSGRYSFSVMDNTIKVFKYGDFCAFITEDEVYDSSDESHRIIRSVSLHKVKDIRCDEIASWEAYELHKLMTEVSEFLSKPRMESKEKNAPSWLNPVSAS